MKPMPIEIAPKDGTLIDVWYHGSRYTDVRWNAERGRWEYYGRDSFENAAWIEIGEESYEPGVPTHWMTIPEVPWP